MADYFECAPLGSLCVDNGGVQTGPFGSQLHQEDYVATGTPIITVEHLGENRITRSNLPLVSNEDKARLSRYSLEEGDIVFSRVGSVDRRALVRKEEDGWLFSGRCLRVRVDKERICPQFLSWVFGLEGFKQHIRRVAVGATMPSINTKILSEILVYFPSLVEQKRIAEVLGALDDKIELNRRMNATLEATARALFQSWFVDFDPVRAKLDGRQPSGMDATAAALFPDSFEESSLGNIPKGWEVRTIESICGTVTRGVTPEYEEGSKRFIINQRVNRGTDLDWSSLKEISSKLEVPEDRYAKKWDVLVNCLGEGTLGRVHLFKGESNLYAVDQHMSICRGEHPSVGVFLYQVLSAPTGQDKIESLKTGSTGMTMFNISKLRTFDLIWPGATLARSYFDAVQPLWLQIASNEKQSRTLATLRDTLLPKLLSGELSLKEAA
jgi:type I restriction enzyme S subunit